VLFGHGLGSGFGVAVYSMETGERRELIQGGVSSHYTPSGHLIYEQSGNLMAVPFDARRLTVTGAAVPVVEGVARSPNVVGAQYSVSDTGSLAYVPGVATPLRQLVWVSRNGTEQPVAAPARGYVNPRISPDGRRVGLGIEEGADTQVWAYDLARGTLTRLTFQGTTNDIPVWTPDGKRVAYLSDQEKGAQNLFWQLADGTGGVERLTTSATSEQPGSWSRDGRVLAFMRGGGNTGRDIWVLQVADRKAEVFLQTTFIEGAARFSPDGRYLAYVSNESGRPEIYVQPYPGPGGKWQISTEGGTEPVWNPNGRDLFYRNGDKMMAVDVSTQPSFSPGTPRALFERHYRLTPFPQTIPTFDVSSDGQRFLMIKENEQASTQINIVLNWFEELKQRVPAGTK
jgi:Tol biopolymer transport system component